MCQSLSDSLLVLKTRSRKVITLLVGQWIARETVWSDPSSRQSYCSADLRRLVAPGCNYGYDVLVYVGRSLFVEAQPVRQIVAQLAKRHVFLSLSTVVELGRRFVALLALAHRRCAGRLQQAMSLQGGYILHLHATYEEKSPMLMTGMDAVMEIVLGNIKLPSEKTDGIVPFLRHLKQCFGAPLACVHDMSKGILAAIHEVFPDVPDFICHFHFLRDLGKDLLGDQYDTLRKRIQTHGTLGRLRARLRTWQKQIDADPQLQEILAQLPLCGWPTQSVSQAPLIAAYLLAHWILAGLQQGQGYGFPFDRPLMALAERAQQVHAHLQSLISLSSDQEWRHNLPFLEQIEHYDTKLFASPLVVSTPQGPRTIQPQRTNNLMERFFRDLKRHCRRRTGCHALGRTLRTLLPDTTLVSNLQNPQYLKILLDGQPNLEALFAQSAPATVREELQKAQQNPERVPRALKKFISAITSPDAVKHLIINRKSN